MRGGVGPIDRWLSRSTTRRPRGSIGRSLNPLGALVPIGVGPGTQLRSESSMAEAFDGRSLEAAIRRSPLSDDRSPRFQGGADPKIRRSAGRPTIPRDPRSVSRPPRASVSRFSGHPYRGNSSRLGFRRSVPTVRGASGSPLWRPGKVDQGPAHRKPMGGFIFAICRPVFAGGSPRVLDQGFFDLARTRETPRELRPKPQPSRGSRCHPARKAGPRPDGDPERPKPLLPRPGVSPVSVVGNVGIGLGSVKRYQGFLFAS